MDNTGELPGSESNSVPPVSRRRRGTPPSRLGRPGRRRRRPTTRSAAPALRPTTSPGAPSRASRKSGVFTVNAVLLGVGARQGLRRDPRFLDAGAHRREPRTLEQLTPSEVSRIGEPSARPAGGARAVPANTATRTRGRRGATPPRRRSGGGTTAWHHFCMSLPGAVVRPLTSKGDPRVPPATAPPGFWKSIARSPCSPRSERASSHLARQSVNAGRAP